MRKIEKIIIHCSAGNQSAKAGDIVFFHTGPKSRGCYGWRVPGYHYFIEADGKIVELLPIERVSNGCRGHNATAINICYAGGVDLTKGKPYPAIDNRTPAQKASLRALLRKLRQQFPHARIHSHRDFANKACPSFDATSEYSDI